MSFAKSTCVIMTILIINIKASFMSLKQQLLSMQLIFTLFVIETQLSSFVLAPAEYSSGQGESKAVVSPGGYLCQRNARQRLEGVREQLAGLPLPESELPAGVLAPREQLTIWEGTDREAEQLTGNLHLLSICVVMWSYQDLWTLILMDPTSVRGRNRSTALISTLTATDILHLAH